MLYLLGVIVLASISKGCVDNGSAPRFFGRGGANALPFMRLLAIALSACIAFAAVYPETVLASTASMVKDASTSESKNNEFKEVNACKGMTADEALEVAEKVEIAATFEDSAGVDVTEYVKDSSNGSDVHGAIVKEVETYDLWLLGKSVTFTLDYTDPVEQAKREKEKKEEAKRKKALKAVEACKGKTADEALELARKADCAATFEDSAGVDVTSDVEDAKNKSDVHDALVTKVERKSSWFFGESVVFSLDYVDPVAKQEREEEAAKEKDRQEALEELAACKGKTAWEAYELAKEADYSVVFRDSFDVSVTSAVKDGGKDSDAGSAVVTEVTVSDSWLFLGGSASISLDYVDPEAAKEREEEARRKEQQELREKNRATIEESVGKGVGKIQTLVDSSGFDLKICDKYGTDITDKVREAKRKSKTRKSKITNVIIDDFEDPPLVTLDIDYLDSTSVKKNAKQYGFPSEVTFSDISAQVEDEKPAEKNPSFFVTVTGTVTSNDDWTVGQYYLPSLGVSTDAFNRCAELELDNGKGELAAGETCTFTYHYRLYYTSKDIVLQTYNEGVKMHGADDVINAVSSQFEAAKQRHDDGYEQSVEDDRQEFETQRNAETCYITPTGECYHTSRGCPSLSRSKPSVTTVGEAEALGLRPCSRCH